MNILITGAKGFIGKNLAETLNNIKNGKDQSFNLTNNLTIFKFDIDTDPKMLDFYCQKADFIFHLAGVNRPEDQSEYMKGNLGFTSILLDTLRKYKKRPPVMLSSSIQAEMNNPYGQSKRAGEELVFQYSIDTKSPVYVYRFPNVFGKWCRPNYNSVVATFCNNIANDIPIMVSDPAIVMNLVYIDDVIVELINCLKGNATKDNNLCSVSETYKIALGEIVDLLYSFKASRDMFSDAKLTIPDMSNTFTKKLYATYLSYLPTDGFSYDLKMNCDNRGSFTEIIRSYDKGQFSVNISKPGITKGNHWHNTKNEKFIVVSGRGVIRFRKIGIDMHGCKYPIIEYFVDDEHLKVVDIPTGYTHHIENLCNNDLVTLIWCNECFNSNKPDTFYEEV